MNYVFNLFIMNLSTLCLRNNKASQGRCALINWKMQLNRIFSARSSTIEFATGSGAYILMSDSLDQNKNENNIAKSTTMSACITVLIFRYHLLISSLYYCASFVFQYAKRMTRTNVKHKHAHIQFFNLFCVMWADSFVYTLLCITYPCLWDRT